MSYKKNTAVTGLGFGLVSKTDGSAITTGTVTGYVTLDGGTQASLTNSPTHDGNGQWSVDLTAAEMNGDVVKLAFVHADAVNVYVTIKTVVKLVSDLNDASNATLEGRLSAARAGYLDKLNVSGTLAHSDAAATYKADVSGLSTFDASTDTVTVGTNNDKTGYSLTQTFPDNFASLGINASGHVSRVTLVDTTTTNTDMRGTDDANKTAPPTAAAISTQVASDLATAHGAGTWTTATGFSTFDASADKVTPIDVDGLTHESAMELLMAVIGGVTTVSGSTAAFKLRDGTTTKLTVTYGDSDGERTGSVIA